MKEIISRTTDSNMAIVASQYKNGHWKISALDASNGKKKEIDKSLSEGQMLATFAIILSGKQLLFKNLDDLAKSAKKLINKLK